MCGIIAAFNKEGEVNDWVVNQYEEQFSRGQRGFGSAFIAKDKTVKILRACEPVKALIDLYMNKCEAIVMHHRYPTSTENYLEQTHPLKVSDGSLKYDYLVVHNGVISNEDLLKKTHEDLGFVYTTAYETVGGTSKFNDSESLAIEVARFIEEQTDEVGVQGSAAFVAVQIGKDGKNKDKVTRIFFGKNEGSPLNLSASNKKIRISSEGEGESIKPFTLYSFDPSGKYEFEKRKMKFKALTTPASTSSIGFSANRPAMHTGWTAEDDYNYGFKGYTPHNVALKGDTVSAEEVAATLEKEEIIKECNGQVAMIMETFSDDLKDASKISVDPGGAIGEIADAIYGATRTIEDLVYDTEDDTIVAPGSTVFND